MHIGFLTPEFPHLFSGPLGGIGTSIQTLSQSLVKKGINVTVFVYGQKLDKKLEEGGIKIYFIKQRVYPLLGWLLYRKFLQAYINEIILSEGIDLIEAPDWTGITAFMKFKCPLVVRLHGSDGYFCHLEKRKQKRKNFWFEKLALNNADHIVSVSRFTAEKTAKIFGLKKEMTFIPNSVDVNCFRPIDNKAQSYRVLYFGSIIRKKGILELADIFEIISRKYSKATFVMAGRDIQDLETGKSTRLLFQNKLSPLAAEKVKWLGSLSQKQVQQEISLATVVVLPSFAEALPMAWLEAMAMEKALVTSNIGWAKEIMINTKTGYTADPKDHSGFADKIIRFLDNSELRVHMGKAARRHVINNFSSEVIVDKNMKFYGKIIRNL